ncbi:MAG: hypothetical protein L0Y45_00460 [Woeseiaceae bacterium]|nr:hypothetical protein [Woeseiaceae bacterium]
MQDDWKTADSPRVLKACAHVLAGERRRLIGGLFLLCCPVALQAAEWSFEPAVTAALGYETNAALTVDPHDAVSEAILAPRIDVRRATETSSVDIGALAVATYYSGNDYFEDTLEGLVTLSSFVQSTERTRLGLDARSRLDYLYRTTATNPGTGDIEDVDIGLVTTRVSRSFSNVRPSLSYALSERSSATLRYQLTDAEFGDVGQSGLVDYQQHFVSGVYSYKLTDASNLEVVVQGRQYRPDRGTDSDTEQLLAGILHRFSPTVRAGFRAGIGNTTQTTPDGNVDTSSYVFEARAVQEAELSRLQALLSHDVQPSGLGESVSANQLRLDWNRKLSPITSFRLRARVLRAEALEGPDPTVDRRYAEVDTGLNWALAPEWSLGLGYQYRYRKFDADLDTAQSHGVFAGLSWLPQQRKRR